jgi:CheY-like chemotaxis protein
LLQPHAIMTLALVVHELVTNSVKYGALSTTGTVRVTVESDETTGIWLRWRERGGPRVTPPVRRGFGSVIVERSVPFDLQGTADVRYPVAGFEADFFIPGRHVWFGHLPSAPPPHATTVRRPAVAAVFPDRDTPLAGLRVLLVEDNMLIALDAEDMLMALGALSVVLVSTLGAAADAIAATPFQFAVLDISVGQGSGFELASGLKKLQIPYIFASGYGDGVRLTADHSEAIVVQKPYRREDLRAAIRQIGDIHRA